MKKQFIVILILLSLFLNVIHDFVVLKESSDRCEVSTLLIENSMEHNCCKKSVEIHKTFHFVAILSNLKILFQNSKSSISIKSNTLLANLHFELFKPPQF